MKKKESKLNPYNYLFKIFDYMPAKRKKQFFILLSGMVLVALFETSALGVISLFASSIASPEGLISSNTFQKYWSLLPFSINLNPELLIAILSCALVVITIIKNIARGVMNYWVTRFGAVIQGFVGEYILDRYLSVNYVWHLDKNAHDLLVTLRWRQNFGTFLNSVLTIVSDLILVIIMLTSIFIVQPKVMLIVTTVIGVLSLLIYSFLKRVIDSNSIKIKDLSRETELEAAKIVMGMKDVRIFGLENLFFRSYSNKVYLLARKKGAQKVYIALPAWIMEVVGYTIVSVAIMIMLYVMDMERINIFSTISLLAISAWKVLPAINRILKGITSLRTSLPFLERVFQFIDEINHFMEPRHSNVRNSIITNELNMKNENDKNNFSFNEKMSFCLVSFSYSNSERKALDNISFEIKKGSSVGVIGHSGAGKSTLVDLLIGLLRPSSGEMKIDGVACDDKLIRNWRGQIGYVPQFPYIYDCSLAENIAFGEKDIEIDEARILEICNNASIDFLDQLEEGIYTRIGDRGMRLSGGQRQRVSIARALYHKPDVLVFDEATSSLDTKSEKEIKDTIDSFKGVQTLVIIAHRLTTVEDCDKIIWIENGAIRNIGKPVEVLPLYNRIKDEE